MTETNSQPDPHPDRRREDLRAGIVRAIVATAPDVADEIPDLDDSTDLFEEYGLDSMDRLGIMTAIAESTGVEIPDDQYAKLTTMNDLIAHLS